VSIKCLSNLSIWEPLAPADVSSRRSHGDHSDCQSPRRFLEKAAAPPWRGSTVLTESEIRPDNLMEGQKRAFANDVRGLQERSGQFVDVACPACASRNPRSLFSKNGFAYVACGVCDTMYLNPRPSPEVLDWYYANSENYAYWNKHIFPASEAARRDKIFRPRAERLKGLCAKYDVSGGAMLEVGSGFGTFGEEIRKLGVFDRYIGVEPTPDLAATCRARGLEIIEKPIEHIDLTGIDVSCVAAFEVIEHLFDPSQFLAAVRKAMRPGALLVVSCPNGKGFEIDVLQQAAGSVDPEHLNYFHPESLSRCVAAGGFEVLEVLTPGELDAELVRKKALEGAVDLSGQRFLKQVLIDRWNDLGGPFQKFLKDNMLSSHMWLVARAR
jgi:SAM-dependent methyltransferase